MGRGREREPHTEERAAKATASEDHHSPPRPSLNAKFGRHHSWHGAAPRAREESHRSEQPAAQDPMQNGPRAEDWRPNAESTTATTTSNSEGLVVTPPKVAKRGLVQPGCTRPPDEPRTKTAGSQPESRSPSATRSEREAPPIVKVTNSARDASIRVRGGRNGREEHRAAGLRQNHHAPGERRRVLEGCGDPQPWRGGCWREGGGVKCPLGSVKCPLGFLALMGGGVFSGSRLTCGCWPRAFPLDGRTRPGAVIKQHGSFTQLTKRRCART